MNRQWITGHIALLGLCVSGCTGEIGVANGGLAASGPEPELGQDSSPQQGRGGREIEPLAAAEEARIADFFPGSERAATPSRAWRMSWVQFDGAASSLLGESASPSDFLDDELLSGAGYLNEQRFLDVADSLAEQFAEAAESLAPQLAAKLTPCEMGDDSCIDAFVATQGRRIWRRPLAEDELARYRTLYEVALPEFGAGEATELVLSAMLRSPFHLYRFEAGNPDDVVGSDLRLSPHAAASALSFALWNEPPDGELAALADEGRIFEEGVFASQADRLLADPRALDTLFDFLAQWLGFYDVADAEKDTELFPEWSSATGEAMLQETHAFVVDVVNSGGGFEALLTASHSFPGEALGWVYGEQTDGERLESRERMGILMQPSFLTSHAKQAETSPTLRGVFAVSRLGCYDPPPPDANVVANPPPPDRTLTTRERFERHQSDPVCATCHRMFDPIGLAFESFDAVGRYRTEENGLPLNLEGELARGVLAPEAVHFTAPEDVALTAAGSAIVHQCFVRNMFQYLTGREPLPTDDPWLSAAMKAFVASGLDLRELVFALVTHPEFVLRHPAE